MHGSRWAAVSDISQLSADGARIRGHEMRQVDIGVKSAIAAKRLAERDMDVDR